MLNIALKTAIAASGKPQMRIAQLARMNEIALSNVVRGRRKATTQQRQRLSVILGQPIATLFPDGMLCLGDGGDNRSTRCPANDHSNGDRDYTVGHQHSKGSGAYALRHRWI